LDDQFDDVVAGFHKAASGQLEWGEALRSFQQLVGAWLVQVQGIDFSRVAVTLSYEVGPCPPEAVLDYLCKWHRFDPRARLVMELDEGEWVSCHEHFDNAFVERSAFYQEFLIPHGGRYVSGTQLFRQGDEVVMLGVHRGRNSQPLDGDEIICCRRLARHLAQAMRIYRAHQQRAPLVTLGVELVSRVRTPIVLIDDHCRLHYANAAAREILESGGPMVERAGLLVCLSSADDVNLATAMRQLALAGDSYVMASSPTNSAFLRIGRQTTGAVGIYLYAVRPQATLGGFGEQALAMGLIHDSSVRASLDPLMVAVGFDLTPRRSASGYRARQRCFGGRDCLRAYRFSAHGSQPSEGRAGQDRHRTAGRTGWSAGHAAADRAWLAEIAASVRPGSGSCRTTCVATGATSRRRETRRRALVARDRPATFRTPGPSITHLRDAKVRIWRHIRLFNEVTLKSPSSYPFPRSITMNMQCFGRWVLLFLLSGLSAFASGGEWISDSQGCKVFWAKAFTAGESITWSGTCRDGHAEGSGVLDFLKDGKLSERFEGTLEKGKVAVPWHARVGRGTLSWPNGDRYEGDIVDGRRTGKGVYSWADGSRYEGDFVDGKITGKGVHLWADGNRYEGDFVDYKPRGKGVMVLKEGHRYEGDFIDGRMSGKGVMVSKEGHRYEGDFIDYKMTGKGIWVTPRGGRYEGDFVNGIRNGKGVFVNSSGQRMEGHFVDGKFTKGIMQGFATRTA